MTKKEFQDKLTELSETISKLKKEYQITKRKYIDEHKPFPEGTKVKITVPDREVGFMKHLQPGYVKYGFVKYWQVDKYGALTPGLVQVKKDGTPSRMTLTIFGLKNDVKIEKAEEL